MTTNTKIIMKNTTPITTTFREKMLMPLLLDTWLLSPLIKDGEVEPIESVVKRRSKAILHIANSLGKYCHGHYIRI